MARKHAADAQNAHLGKVFKYNVAPKCQMAPPLIASHAR